MIAPACLSAQGGKAMWKGLLGLALSLTLLGASFALSGERPKAKPPDLKPESKKGWKLDILSSSHQDIAWMNSPEACMEYRDTHCITPALVMMAQNPDYCFVMENMLNLMEYIERHPERREDILRFTREGRMEWGATFNQPYESLLSGEQLIRETYFGRKWLKKNFPGCDARVYFNPDVPGRSLQMQQVLSKAGIPYMVISRYHEGFYRWSSPDGSSVLAYTPGHYTNASTILGAPPEEGAKLLESKLAAWEPYYQEHGIPPEFPLLHSVDFSQPTDFGPLIQLWNSRHPAKEGSPQSKMRYSSAAHFFDSLAKANPSLNPVQGERPNLWLYIHGPTHHWAITAQREAGRLLPAAELFTTVASLLEGDIAGYPAREMEDAWKAAIYPDHGWGGKEGQITDRLFRKKYELARDRGKEMLDGALLRIAGRVETSASKGTPIIVFNGLSWQRSDPVVIAIASSRRDWQVQDARGQLVPSQVLPPLSTREEDIIRLEFIAADVPGLGYKTFYLTKSGTGVASFSPSSPMASVYENDFYEVELAPGGLRRIYDKEVKADILNTGKFLGLEVFTMQSVGNGAGEFGRVQQPTMEGFDQLSRHGASWQHDALESGPLRAVFRLKEVLSNCTIEEKIVIYNRIKRIDCEVSILDWDGTPYREFRLALPVDAEGGQVVYEVPLGVVEVGRSEIPGTGGPAYGKLNYDELCSEIRPREVQNFLSVSGKEFGLTMSTSVAVNDYRDPTPDPASYPVLQAVLLTSRRSCHGEGNWYLQEGAHHYRFSLTSHHPGWTNGYKSGIQANSPLFPVVDAQPAAGANLPEEKGFFGISAPNVLVSTIKKCEDDDSVIVRLYDIEGKDAEVHLTSAFALAKVEHVNIIEEEGKPLPCRMKSVKLRLGHHAIETLKLWPKQNRSQSPSGEAITPAQESNFVLIAPGDPVEKIVRSAATIVPSPNQLAWQEMEFIAFVHFGMNTFTDREWGEGTESPSLFNPSDFDARQWARVLRDAGLKMIIVTAKHHDGFCLWPSQYTEHSVKNSPWRKGKGDVVGEVAEACRETGLKLGIYLSPWDRHEPTYGDSPAYNEHFRSQLRELLTNYGEVGEVWFDGACGEGPNGKRQEYDWPSYYRVVRECQPKAVIFGMGPDLRWVGTETGYGRETEWSVVPVQIKEGVTSPSTSLDDLFVPGDMTAEDLGSRGKIAAARALAWYPAETDVSIRPGWFYHASQGQEVKAPEKLIDIYFSSVGRNGVLLLNIPPDKRGLIHENDIRSLMGMRHLLDKTFGVNIASGAKVKTSSERGGHPVRSIMDEDKGTYWTTAEGVDSAALEFALPEKRIFDVAMLQEEIHVGQRVEEFSLEYWNGSDWIPFAQGTTIGHKRLLRFPEISTDKVRLTIAKSRTSPTLAAFGLFKLAS
jgi:alpha-mannosidase